MRAQSITILLGKYEKKKDSIKIMQSTLITNTLLNPHDIKPSSSEPDDLNDR